MMIKNETTVSLIHVCDTVVYIKIHFTYEQKEEKQI